jgi:hypothetical protein
VPAVQQSHEVRLAKVAGSDQFAIDNARPHRQREDGCGNHRAWAFFRLRLMSLDWRRQL